MRIRTWLVLSLCLLAWLGGSSAPLAATLPTGFSDPVIVPGLSAPTAFLFAPDGRIFVTEKSGTVRIVENGVLRTAPMLTVAVSTESERGLLGIALHPSFAANGWFFVYYTTSASSLPPAGHSYVSPKNRVSRFTLSGNTASGEIVIIDDIASDAGNHNAGWVQFGPDGKLYVSTGDGGQFANNSQLLTNLSGKILRLNPDGSIPSDNPFVGIAGRDEIWCYGLRNPWRFTFDPAGRLFIGDVGGGAYEEINVGGPGLNFGWPVVEGPAGNPAYVDPIYSYSHVGATTAVAITAGAFSTSDRYPGVHRRALFFGDYGTGLLRTLQYNPSTPTSPTADLGANAGTPVHFAEGPDGWMYYLSIFPGEIHRIEYARPSITAFGSSPVSPVSAGTPVTWTVQANGVAPIEYQFWRYAAATGAWSIPQPYSSSSSYTWTPTASEAGTYILQAWVRYVGATDTYEDWRASEPFTTPAALTGFSSDTAFPVAAGTTVTWTAQSVGGTGTREYAFWRYNATLQSWTLAQPYGPANTYIWTPGPRDGGLHVVQVWVRSQGSGLSYEDWRSTGYFEVTTASPALLDVVSNRPDIVAPGTSVTWTAYAAGGTSPLLYQFWRHNETDGHWTLAQPFSTASSYTWTTGLADRGAHHVQVWVKSTGAPSFEDWRTAEMITVTSVGPVSVTPDASGSPGSGTTITWTATAAGSPAPLEYRFWRFNVNAGTWTLARDYSTDPTHSWVATSGSYVIQVWVRSAGSPASYERWTSSGILTVHP